MRGAFLPQDIGTALVNYLAQKPWVEVQELLPALLNLEEIELEGEDDD